ncbi:MAG: hypothetical protein Q8Q30_00140 [Candidatus Woesebacteria bacterium]|nr:hypothetical protein [Candidatus Woesebacteria bacterium]
MTESKTVPEQPNNKTASFLDNFTSSLIKKYQKKWKDANALTTLYQSKDLTKFPHAKQLQEDLEHAQKTIIEMEERAFIVKEFKSAVSNMFEIQTEIPLPPFLIPELLTIEDKDLERVVAESYDADGTKLMGYGEGVPKTGYIAKVFSGDQFALKLEYGYREKEKFIPTIKPTTITLIPTKLLTGQHK